MHLHNWFLVTADNGHVDDDDEGVNDEVMCDASVDYLYRACV